MTLKHHFRLTYDSRLIAWGKPDSPRRSLCAICHGALPPVPLIMWKDDGSCIALCDDCTSKHVEFVKC